MLFGGVGGAKSKLLRDLRARGWHAVFGDCTLYESQNLRLAGRQI
jgi:hypothetical protein